MSSPNPEKENARGDGFFSVTQRDRIKFIIWKALIFENTFGNLHLCSETHVCDLAAARKRLEELSLQCSLKTDIILSLNKDRSDIIAKC